MRGVLLDLIVIGLALLGFAWWYQLPPSVERPLPPPVRPLADSGDWQSMPVSQQRVRLHWQGDTQVID